MVLFCMDQPGSLWPGQMYKQVRDCMLGSATDYSAHVAACDARASEIATSQLTDFTKRINDGGTLSKENPHQLSFRVGLPTQGGH